MYLDTHELEEWKMAAMGYYFARMRYVMHRFHAIFAVTAIVSLLTFFAGLAFVLWILPPDKPWWAIWIPSIVMGIILLIGQRWARNQWNRVATKEELEARFQEIEHVEAGSEDRQLFLRLVAAMRGGTRQEVESLTEEAMRSPALSKLTFIHDLQIGLQEMH